MFQDKNRKNVGLFCIALLCLWTIASALQIQTSNPINIGIFAVLFGLMQYIQKEVQNNRKEIAAACGLSIFFSAAIVFSQLDSYSEKWTIPFMLLGNVILCFQVLRFFFWWVGCRGISLYNTAWTRLSAGTGSIRKLFWFAAAGILLCWLPFYLYEFPGIVISDSYDQLGQMMTGVYRNHHPVAHTWFESLFIMPVYHLTGDVNAGIAVYCSFQMILMAVIDAWLITFLHRIGMKRIYCAVIFLYYALIPYHAMYSFNMWKDTLFAACVLLVLGVLWKNLILGQEQERIEKVLDAALYLLASLGFCLFRTNGWYAYLVLMVVVGIVFRKKQRRLVLLTILAVAGVLVFKGPILNAYQVTPVDTIEALSIPAQQVARVVAEDGVLSEEQQRLLEEIVEVERIKEAYTEDTSDPIKYLVRETDNQQAIHAQAADYLKLWIQLGLRYPGKYIKAYIAQTNGYWYPDVQRWVYESGMFQGIGNEKIRYSIIPESIIKYFKIPFLWEYTKVPLLGLLWSPGMAVWISLILAAICWLKKLPGRAVLFLPLLALWGTLLIATPVNGEFRYIYYLFETLPLLAAAAFYHKEETLRI